MSTIVNTEYKLPQSIVGNGVTTGNQFSNPNNLLLLDEETADSQSGVGELSDIIVGNFNLDLPQNAVITGIQLKLVAERGSQTSPVITIIPVLVNDLSGVNEYYPGDTFSGLTEDLEEHILGNQYDLWGKVWTVDEINNLKVQLIPAGDVRVDSVLPKVFYYIAEDPLPPNPIEAGCEDCNSTIEALPFTLAKTFRIDETKFILKSFALIDGTPIDLSMLGDCGGEITVTFDQGQYKIPGQNFQEDAVITSADATITTLPNGFVEIDLGTINNRGLMPIKPYTHDPDLLSEHSVGTKVIISNSARYQNRFVQKCHIGVLVSAPIKTLDENNEVVPVTENFNFIGDTIQAEQDDINPKQANVTVISNPTNTTPEVEDTTTGTTGSTPATSLTIEHEITDANYLRVWISTENETISSVTYDGVSMTLIGQEINAPEGLKVALYGLINPAVGANDIVVTMANAVNITAGGVSFLNVDTSNPTDGVSSGAIGTSAAPSDSITTTVNNTVIQDVVGTKNNPTVFAQSGLWTIRGQVNAASRPGASSTRKVLVPGTVTDTYAISGSYPWAMIIAGVRGAVLPSAAYVESVTGTYMDDSDPQNVVSVVPLNNTATVAPTVTDDSSAGYAVDSKWFDKLTGTLYTCEDATVGAAVWTAIVGGVAIPLEVEEDGVSKSTAVTKINFTGGATVTETAPGEVDVDFSSLGGSGGTLIDSDATTHSVAKNIVGTTETTIYTIPVPGGTLGTKNAIRTNVLFDDSLNLNNGAQATIRVKYGGTTIGSILLESSGATVTAGFSMKLENIILAAGSASSQKNYTKLSLSQDNIIFQSTTPQISHNGDGSEYTTSSVDSSNNQDIEVTIQYNSTPNSLIVAEAIVVEKISSGVGSALDVQLNGVSVENPVDTINIIAPTGTVTTPSAGVVDIDLTSLIGSGTGTKLAIDTTQISTNNQTFTTLYTVPIPGGILGNNNAIRFKVLLGNLQIAANKDLYVKFVYGGSDVTGTLLFDNDGASGSGVPGVIEGVIVADNATNAQKGYSQILWQENGTHSTPISYGTATVDASISQNLELQVRFSDAGCIIRADAIIVEKITDGNDINNIEFFDDFVQNVKTAADAATERGVSGNFIIENVSGADPAYVQLGSSETNHPGIVDLTGGAELYGFTNVNSAETSTQDRTIPVGNDFNFSGLFRSTRPGGSFDSIFGLSLDGIGFGIYVRFNSATSATKVLFYDGSVQTTTAINLPTSNTWTSFEIDWNVGTSTLVFKIGGVTVYSGTPTFTGSHIGFSAGSVGGTAGTKLSFDYITTTYTVTR